MWHFSQIIFAITLLSFTSTGNAAEVKSYLREDFSGQQWKYFKNQAKQWRGLNMLVNATGKVILSTKLQRKFERLPDGFDGLPAYLQTNTYENISVTNGVRRQQLIYVKTKPPTWGRLVYPNGTVNSAPLSETVSFFKSYGHYCDGYVSSSPDSRFFCENYLILPSALNVKFSSVIFYSSLKFLYVLIHREVSGNLSFPGGPWKGGLEVDVLNSTQSLKGAWTIVTSCLREPSQIHEQYVRTEENDIAPIPFGPEFVTLRMKDGPITLSFPATFAPIGFDRDVKFYQEWKVSNDYYVRDILSFAPNGRIKRHCVSIYLRIFGLE